MVNLHCIIVEDDAAAQLLLQTMIEKTSFLVLKKIASNALEAIEYLKTETVDLIFLDMEMPGLSGLQFLDVLTQKPSIIIVSGEQKYALDAFRYSVADYLLKPVTDYGRFMQAVLKVQGLKETQAKKETPENSQLFVKVDSLLQSLAIESILWLEANSDYVKIHTDKKTMMVLSTMKALEEKLPPDQFVRVHRSFIVNIKHIENIDQANLQIGSKIIPISSNYRASLLEKIRIL
ncbi:MAG: response regulator transcription factor [Cyclobacteriaceae bacterium]|nr:response regulator transcription factor [Cyclobacteriaceae bacterium]